MTRRRFLAFLGLAPVVGPAAVRALAVVPPRNPLFSGKLCVWKYEFDYANRVGFAIGSVWDYRPDFGDNAIIVVRPSARAEDLVAR